jgi:RNA polymerase II subunit A-like phosphatase
MQKKYAPLLILMARPLEDVYSVEMKVGVSLPPSLAFLSLVLRCHRGLTQKSLQRLFPCDTSMVVIIDDRADVWEWSPNLIKVIPCMFIRYALIVVLNRISDDFFVGIGDINSTFLPKLEPLMATTSPRPDGSEPKEPPVEGSTNQNLPMASQSTPPEPGFPPTTTPLSTTIPVPSDDGAERAQLAANAMLKQNNLALEAQLEERPLAKKQEALQEGDAAAHHIQHNTANNPPAGAQTNQEDTLTHKHEKRKALLKNDDYELQRVAKVRSDPSHVYNVL